MGNGVRFIFKYVYAEHQECHDERTGTMDVKDKIKKAIEQNGIDIEKLNDLFRMVCHCEVKAERREWLLYVRSEARTLRSVEAYELIRKNIKKYSINTRSTLIILLTIIGLLASISRILL